MAQIVTAVIQTAVIDWAQIEELKAAIIEVLHAEIQVGTFTLAEVENLLAEALVLKKGTAESMYITNLAVTSANLLSAMLGKLVLKGEDGKYYQVMIGADGTIHTQEVQPSEAEIEAGETESGQGIVDTSANFADLTAQNIKGNEAIFQTILAQSLTAGEAHRGGSDDRLGDHPDPVRHVHSGHWEQHGFIGQPVHSADGEKSRGIPGGGGSQQQRAIHGDSADGDCRTGMAGKGRGDGGAASGALCLDAGIGGHGSGRALGGQPQRGEGN